MLYIRRIIDLMLASVFPSLIAEFVLSQFPSLLQVYIIGTVFSVIFFYFVNLLLLRRFVFDIKREDLYFKTQIVAWAFNAGLAVLFWYVKFGNALSYMYLPLRLIEVLSISPVTYKPEVRTIVSVAIMLTLNLVVTFAVYPILRKSKRAFEEELKMEHEEEISNEDILKYSIRYDDEEEDYGMFEDEEEDENILISARENQRLNELENVDRNAVLKKSKKHIKERTSSNFWGFVLNLWSYSFYQRYLNKVEEGYARIPILIHLLRKKLSIFGSASRRRRRF